MNGPYHYFVYGISLSSELPLSLPPDPTEEDADVELRTAPNGFFEDVLADTAPQPSPSGWYSYAFLADGSTYLRWDGLFEFLISPEGRLITCQCIGERDMESFQVYLLGHALSFALIKQGYEPLHGTAVIIGGQAVALLGDCGFGKSTLADSFLQAGYSLLTDDLLALRIDGDTVWAHSGPSRIKLLPDSATTLLGPHASGVPMNPLTEKLVIKLDGTRRGRGAVPLKAIFSLAFPGAANGTDVRIDALSLREAFLELIRAAFNTLYVKPSRLTNQFQRASELVRHVNVQRLVYPRSWDVLPAVHEAVLRHLSLPGKESIPSLYEPFESISC